MHCRNPEAPLARSEIGEVGTIQTTRKAHDTIKVAPFALFLQLLDKGFKTAFALVVGKIHGRHDSEGIRAVIAHALLVERNRVVHRVAHDAAGASPYFLQSPVPSVHPHRKRNRSPKLPTISTKTTVVIRNLA